MPCTRQRLNKIFSGENPYPGMLRHLYRHPILFPFAERSVVIQLSQVQHLVYPDLKKFAKHTDSPASWTFHSGTLFSFFPLWQPSSWPGRLPSAPCSCSPAAESSCRSCSTCRQRPAGDPFSLRSHGLWQTALDTANPYSPCTAFFWCLYSLNKLWTVPSKLSSSARSKFCQPNKKSTSQKKWFHP